MMSTLVSGSKIGADVVHQFVHRHASVVARDVVVQILPDPLDPIVVGAVGRQKVEFQFLSRLRLHRQSHLVTVMNAVIVENEVNALGVGIGLRHQFVEKIQKQQAGLSFAFDVGEPTRFGVPRAGEILFLVAPRRQHLLLAATMHPIRSDLGVEMNVNLVEIQHDLVGWQTVDKPLNRPQSTRPTRFFPRTVDDRFGPSQPNLKSCQKPAHSGDADLDSGLGDEHQDQQFLSPGGSPVAVLLGRLVNEADKFGLVGRRRFALAVVLAPVREPRQTVFDEALSDAVNLRLGGKATVSDLRGRLALNQGKDDFAATPHSGILGSHGKPPKFLPLSLGALLPSVDNFRLNQGGAPSTGVLVDTT